MTYEASTLQWRKGKWYVCVTVPPQLRDAFKDKQRRKGTGTADKGEARRRQHDLTSAIYTEFDTANRSPLQRVTEELQEAVGWTSPKIDPRQFGLEPEEAEELRHAALSRVYAPPTGDFEEDIFIENDRERVELLLAKFNAEFKGSKLSQYRESYEKDRRYGRAKTKKAAVAALDDFIELVGNISIGEVTKLHAYTYAKSLAEDEYSNSTVKTRVGYVRQYLDYLEREGHVKSNPFTDLKLSTYGTKGESYAPLSIAVVTQLFAQDLPSYVRLCLEILATTGMRLDEVALLSYKQIHEERGIRYFDLTDKETKVKNIGSARQVPIHRLIKIPDDTGRLFPMWKIDADGKAQGPASKELMSYLRNVTKDDRHVVHSLRGHFKDLCRDHGVSKEHQDFITGHGSGDVAGKYGTGPSLETRSEIINMLRHPWMAIQTSSEEPAIHNLT